MKRLALLAVLSLTAAACGGGGTGTAPPAIPAAHVYRLVGFQPSGPVAPGKPVSVSFKIVQPDGTTLTKFRRGAGPHTGVHMVYVRDDLSTIVHHHPPLDGTGKIVDSVDFPRPGPYRLVIDVYPASCGGSSTASIPGAPTSTCNFQLFGKVEVTGAYRPLPLPPTTQAETVDGYHFALSGAAHLRAVEAQLVQVHVTDPQGRAPSFQTWFGALAHAIFFRRGSLDYFHTHVCSPGAVGCTSVLGGAKVVGSSTTPGKLTVGVLVPVSGTWRLFLQVKIHGRTLTAPFTLHVR
jgi:hypothetical protein